MAKKAGENPQSEGTTPPQMEGIDPATIMALLQTFGEVAPQVLALLQTLSDAWKRRRPTMGAAPPVKAANTHACDCCDAALKSAMDTVAHLLDCKDSCTP